MRTSIWLAGTLVTAIALWTAPAGARDVACGEKCDTVMNECTAKCPSPPKVGDLNADDHMVCWNECAKKKFHPCLDACKMPKPSWDKE